MVFFTSFTSVCDVGLQEISVPKFCIIFVLNCKETDTKKNPNENGSHVDILGSGPHSNGELVVGRCFFFLQNLC